MTFTAKDWMALVVSSLFAYLVFGNIFVQGWLS